MADIKYRYVVDRDEDDWEHGHRESNDGSGWKTVLRSESVKNLKRYWFQQSPIQRLADMGIVTTPERAAEFEQLVEEHPYEGWFYLGVMALTMSENGAPAQAEEGLKWIMGALAAELNVRKLGFHSVGEVMPATVLGIFAAWLVTGKIDRTFSKPIFADLLAMGFRNGAADTVERIEAVVANPAYKALDDSIIDEALDRIIAENPDQFAKAKENPKLIQWFLGQIMKATQGKASPAVAKEKVEARLSH